MTLAQQGPVSGVPGRPSSAGAGPSHHAAGATEGNVGPTQGKAAGWPMPWKAIVVGTWGSRGSWDGHPPCSTAQPNTGHAAGRPRDLTCTKSMLTSLSPRGQTEGDAQQGQGSGRGKPDPRQVGKPRPGLRRPGGQPRPTRAAAMHLRNAAAPAMSKWADEVAPLDFGEELPRRNDRHWVTRGHAATKTTLWGTGCPVHMAHWASPPGDSSERHQAPWEDVTRQWHSQMQAEGAAGSAAGVQAE